MSGLYNMVFGMDPLATFYLALLKVDPMQVPRFRDCFLKKVGDNFEIIIYTRTGGVNRDYHEDCDGANNRSLREIKGYIADKDDDFDSTYASFRYELPKELVPPITRLVEMVGLPDEPGTKWKKLFDELGSTTKSPEAQKAREVMRNIYEQMSRKEE